MASYYENRTVSDQPPAEIQNTTPINTNTIALPALLSNGQLNPNNPFAGLGEAAAINYAFGDIPSQTRLDSRVYRVVAGVKGSALDWDYQASVDLNLASLHVEGTGFIYEPQLISDVKTGAYSFINPDSNTAAVRAALAPNLYKTSTTGLDSLDASATRRLFELPGGPMSLAIGGQVRYEAIHNPNINTNDEVASGDGAIQPSFTFGHRTVASVFGEIEAPVLKTLIVNLSGRYDHYSDVGGNFSPKVGAKFTPIKQFAIRGTYSEGFRAPSFSESGNSAYIGYTPYIPANSAPSQFVNAHNNDAYVTSLYNLNAATIGNSLVKPELSNSFTLGFIFDPVRYLNISVDYYNIHKKNVISPPAQGVILADYYAGLPLPSGVSVIPDAPDPQAPTALPRPLVINNSYANDNSEMTDGLDVDVRSNYVLPLDVKWSSEFNFTDILHFTYNNGDATYEYVGTQAPYEISSGAGTPKYRANWSNSFTYGPANITGTLYYTSSFKETGVDATGSTSACLYTSSTGASIPNKCNVSSFVDFDLTARYAVSRRIQIYAYVGNLFDAKAPLDPADYAGGDNGSGLNYNPTYAQAGAIGRAFKLGIHVKY